MPKIVDTVTSNTDSLNEHAWSSDAGLGTAGMVDFQSTDFKPGTSDVRIGTKEGAHGSEQLFDIDSGRYTSFEGSLDKIVENNQGKPWMSHETRFAFKEEFGSAGSQVYWQAGQKYIIQPTLMDDQGRGYFIAEVDPQKQLLNIKLEAGREIRLNLACGHHDLGYAGELRYAIDAASAQVLLKASATTERGFNVEVCAELGVLGPNAGVEWSSPTLSLLGLSLQTHVSAQAGVGAQATAGAGLTLDKTQLKLRPYAKLGGYLGVGGQAKISTDIGLDPGYMQEFDQLLKTSVQGEAVSKVQDYIDGAQQQPRTFWQIMQIFYLEEIRDDLLGAIGNAAAAKSSGITTATDTGRLGVSVEMPGDIVKHIEGGQSKVQVPVDSLSQAMSHDIPADTTTRSRLPEFSLKPGVDNTNTLQSDSPADTSATTLPVNPASSKPMLDPLPADPVAAPREQKAEIYEGVGKIHSVIELNDGSAYLGVVSTNNALQCNVDLGVRVVLDSFIARKIEDSINGLFTDQTILDGEIRDKNRVKQFEYEMNSRGDLTVRHYVPQREEGEEGLRKKHDDGKTKTTHDKREGVDVTIKDAKQLFGGERKAIYEGLRLCQENVLKIDYNEFQARYYAALQANNFDLAQKAFTAFFSHYAEYREIDRVKGIYQEILNIDQHLKTHDFSKANTACSYIPDVKTRCILRADIASGAYKAENYQAVLQIGSDYLFDRKIQQEAELQAVNLRNQKIQNKRALLESQILNKKISQKKYLNEIKKLPPLEVVRSTQDSHDDKISDLIAKIIPLCSGEGLKQLLSDPAFVRHHEQLKNRLDFLVTSQDGSKQRAAADDLREASIAAATPTESESRLKASLASQSFTELEPTIVPRERIAHASMQRPVAQEDVSKSVDVEQSVAAGVDGDAQINRMSPGDIQRTCLQAKMEVEQNNLEAAEASYQQAVKLFAAAASEPESTDKKFVEQAKVTLDYQQEYSFQRSYHFFAEVSKVALSQLAKYAKGQEDLSPEIKRIINISELVSRFALDFVSNNCFINSKIYKELIELNKLLGLSQQVDREAHFAMFDKVRKQEYQKIAPKLVFDTLRLTLAVINQFVESSKIATVLHTYDYFSSVANCHTSLQTLVDNWSKNTAFQNAELMLQTSASMLDIGLAAVNAGCRVYEKYWNQCGLVKFAQEPTLDQLSQYERSQYVLTENSLSYFDKKENALHTVTQDSQTLKKVSSFFSGDQGDLASISKLSLEQKNTIFYLTNHKGVIKNNYHDFFHRLQFTVNLVRQNPSLQNANLLTTIVRFIKEFPDAANIVLENRWVNKVISYLPHGVTTVLEKIKLGKLAEFVEKGSRYVLAPVNTAFNAAYTVYFLAKSCSSYKVSPELIVLERLWQQGNAEAYLAAAKITLQNHGDLPEILKKQLIQRKFSLYCEKNNLVDAGEALEQLKSLGFESAEERQSFQRSTYYHQFLSDQQEFNDLLKQPGHETETFSVVNRMKSNPLVCAHVQFLSRKPTEQEVKSAGSGKVFILVRDNLQRNSPKFRFGFRKADGTYAEVAVTADMLRGLLSGKKGPIFDGRLYEADETTLKTIGGILKSSKGSMPLFSVELLEQFKPMFKVFQLKQDHFLLSRSVSEKLKTGDVVTKTVASMLGFIGYNQDGSVAVQDVDGLMTLMHDKSHVDELNLLKEARTRYTDAVEKFHADDPQYHRNQQLRNSHNALSRQMIAVDFFTRLAMSLAIKVENSYLYNAANLIQDFCSAAGQHILDEIKILETTNGELRLIDGSMAATIRQMKFLFSNEGLRKFWSWGKENPAAMLQLASSLVDVLSFGSSLIESLTFGYLEESKVRFTCNHVLAPGLNIFSFYYTFKLADYVKLTTAQKYLWSINIARQVSYTASVVFYLLESGLGRDHSLLNNGYYRTVKAVFLIPNRSRTVFWLGVYQLATSPLILELKATQTVLIGASALAQKYIGKQILNTIATKATQKIIWSLTPLSVVEWTVVVIDIVYTGVELYKQSCIDSAMNNIMKALGESNLDQYKEELAILKSYKDENPEINLAYHYLRFQRVGVFGSPSQHDIDRIEQYMSSDAAKACAEDKKQSLKVLLARYKLSFGADNKNLQQYSEGLALLGSYKDTSPEMHFNFIFYQFQKEFIFSKPSQSVLSNMQLELNSDAVKQWSNEQRDSASILLARYQIALGVEENDKNIYSQGLVSLENHKDKSTDLKFACAYYGFQKKLIFENKIQEALQDMDNYLASDAVTELKEEQLQSIRVLSARYKISSAIHANDEKRYAEGLALLNIYKEQSTDAHFSYFYYRVQQALLFNKLTGTTFHEIMDYVDKEHEKRFSEEHILSLLTLAFSVQANLTSARTLRLLPAQVVSPELQDAVIRGDEVLLICDENANCDLGFATKSGEYAQQSIDKVKYANVLAKAKGKNFTGEVYTGLDISRDITRIHRDFGGKILPFLFETVRRYDHGYELRDAISQQLKKANNKGELYFLLTQTQLQLLDNMDAAQISLRNMFLEKTGNPYGYTVKRWSEKSKLKKGMFYIRSQNNTLKYAVLNMTGYMHTGEIPAGLVPKFTDINEVKPWMPVILNMTAHRGHTISLRDLALKKTIDFSLVRRDMFSVEVSAIILRNTIKYAFLNNLGQAKKGSVKARVANILGLFQHIISIGSEAVLLNMLNKQLAIDLSRQYYYGNLTDDQDFLIKQQNLGISLHLGLRLANAVIDFADDYIKFPCAQYVIKTLQAIFDVFYWHICYQNMLTSLGENVQETIFSAQLYYFFFSTLKLMSHILLIYTAIFNYIFHELPRHYSISLYEGLSYHLQKAQCMQYASHFLAISSFIARYPDAPLFSNSLPGAESAFQQVVAVGNNVIHFIQNFPAIAFLLNCLDFIVDNFDLIFQSIMIIYLTWLMMETCVTAESLNDSKTIMYTFEKAQQLLQQQQYEEAFSLLNGLNANKITDPEMSLIFKVLRLTALFHKEQTSAEVVYDNTSSLIEDRENIWRNSSLRHQCVDLKIQAALQLQTSIQQRLNSDLTDEAKISLAKDMETYTVDICLSAKELNDHAINPVENELPLYCLYKINAIGCFLSVGSQLMGVGYSAENIDFIIGELKILSEQPHLTQEIKDKLAHMQNIASSLRLLKNPESLQQAERVTTLLNPNCMWKPVPAHNDGHILEDRQKCGFRRQ